MTAIRLLATVGGAALVVAAFFWAMQVLAVKNAEPQRLARLVFQGVRTLMLAAGKAVANPQRRQEIWALYVTVSLLAIVAIAIAQILVGYTLMFYGISTDDMRASYINSVSSLSVLGFGGLPRTLPQSTLALAEAFTGPIFVALLIAYLTNLNSTVSQRQAQLRTIEVKVGAAETGSELLTNALAGPGWPAMTAIWQDWTQEFVQIRASFPTVEGYLIHFSPGLHNQWLADALAVLDAANLRNSALALPADPDAARCLDEGATTMQEMSGSSQHALLRHKHTPASVEVTRSAFDRACADLAKAGAPLAPDRDAAWSAFQQERAAYEQAAIRVGQLMHATVPPWPQGS